MSATRIDKRTRRWCTSVHEAGHAVMHVFLDLPNLRGVSIIRDGESLTVRFKPSPLINTATPEQGATQSGEIGYVNNGFRNHTGQSIAPQNQTVIDSFMSDPRAKSNFVKCTAKSSDYHAMP